MYDTKHMTKKKDKLSFTLEGLKSLRKSTIKSGYKKSTLFYFI